jgi:hypothetical protein
LKRKNICILFSALILASLINYIVIAGDEENPEIIDDEEDLFGSFIEHPIRLKIFQAIGILKIDNYDSIDIKSAWFYEESDNPDYLFGAIKINDLQIISQRAVYSIHWKYNGLPYAVGSHIYNNGKNSSFFVGLDKRFNFNFKECEGNYNFENDIVTFKFKKEFVGNPKPGDILKYTWAWTAIRFNFEALTILFSDGELVKDAAPFILDNNQYGENYIIKY